MVIMADISEAYQVIYASIPPYKLTGLFYKVKRTFMIKIEHCQLNPNTLDDLLSEHLKQRGSDHNDSKISIGGKRMRLYRQLEKGAVIIAFDEHTKCYDIVASSDVYRYATLKH